MAIWNHGIVYKSQDTHSDQRHLIIFMSYLKISFNFMVTEIMVMMQRLLAELLLLKSKPITIIGHQRGKDTKENVKRNFGMPHPEGYRKALRLMKQAEKFNRPIICFIDTKGAYPGKAAEERGQSEAIARNLVEMAGLTVPVISIVIGEGGSGGALALGVANHIHMLEHSTYSVISPEGAASILWKDSSLSKQAAEAMKITAPHLKEMGIIDEMIPEILGGAHRDPKAQAVYIEKAIQQIIRAISVDEKRRTCRESV